MMNFTIGLVSALISFTFSLFSMIWAYKASYLSGLVFFAIAFTGAWRSARVRVEEDG